MIAIDFETYLISEEHPAPKPVCLSWYDGVNTGLLKGKEMAPYLKEILKDQVILAHNMKFEASVIYEWFPELRESLEKAFDDDRLMCSKINEQLIDCFRKQPGHSYSLADLVKRYYQEDISEAKTDPNAWRLRYSELDGAEDWPQEAIDYAIGDSVWAYKIAQLQLPALSGVDVYGPVRAEHYLTHMGLFGIVVDQSRVSTLEREVLDKIKPAQEELLKQNLIRLEKGKYIKNAKAFREYINLTVPKEILETTDKGNVSTSAESLDKYNSTGENPILNNYLLLMQYEKVLTSFVSRLKQAKPLIRTEYNGVVRTGRTSSRTSGLFPSVNIQQMPREVKGVTFDVRNCYVPREGYKICSIDYNGLELASAAHQLYSFYGRSEMRETLNRGQYPIDMHSVLASRIMSMKSGKRVEYDEFVANKKKGEYKEMRQISKQINLGFPGGLGYATMRTLLFKDGVKTKYKVINTAPFESTIRGDLRKFEREGLSSEIFNNLRCQRTGKFEYSLVYDELVSLKKELFNLYPELGEFLGGDHEQFLTGEKKRIKNEFGEWEDEPMYAYQFGGFKRNYCTYTEFCNGYLMQSPSAVGAKRMVCNVVKKYRGTGIVNPLAFIHDEIVFEVKDGPDMIQTVADVAGIMISSMQEVLDSVRIAVEVDVMDYWKKSGGFYTQVFFKDPGKSNLIAVPI